MQAENRTRIDVEIGLRERARFFSNLNGVDKDLFGHMIRYIVKLECSDDGPYHFRCIFFFDGLKVPRIQCWVKRIEQEKSGRAFWTTQFAPNASLA